MQIQTFQPTKQTENYFAPTPNRNKPAAADATTDSLADVKFSAGTDRSEIRSVPSSQASQQTILSQFNAAVLAHGNLDAKSVLSLLE